MKKRLSKAGHDEMIFRIKEKYGDIDLSEIIELLYFLERDDIEECLKHSTFNSFVSCVKSRIQSYEFLERELKRNKKKE